MGLRAAVQLQRAGKLQEAESLCIDHLNRNPSDGDALFLLGTIESLRGRNERALDLMQQAVLASPGSAPMRINLAATLGALGRHEQAMPYLIEALCIQGDIPELHNNIGVTLEGLKRLTEAEAALRNAIRLRGDYADAHFNLGNVLRKQGKFKESIAAYNELIRLSPQNARGYHNLAAALSELGDLDGTIQCYRKAIALEPSNAGVFSSLLYTLHYDANLDAEALYREHMEWGNRHAQPLEGKIRPHLNNRSKDRRLRVGYVSPDFREHTVPRFITAALALHDRVHFELFCYSDAAVEETDSVTRQLQSYAEHWQDIAGLSDSRVEELIRADQIDILVDLRGHAGGNRMLLFCRRPAPIQVNMIGYFNTTGLPTMDYRLTDAVQDPPGQTEMFHTERLIRLPQTCWCYTAEANTPALSELPALKSGHVTFGSLNKIIKVTPACARAWAAVLQAVPGSRLMLSVTGSPQAVARRLADIGLPQERIDLVGKTRTRRQYLDRFSQIDIALDTFPFNGITTTCDGLWMGVPVVTLAGGTSISRAGRSIMTAIGLSHLGADTPAEFVRAAVDLAGDLPALAALRAGMRERMEQSPLADGRRFTLALEKAYQQIWQRWCDE